MNPLEKLATKQHLISLLVKLAERDIHMPAQLVQVRPKAKFKVPTEQYIKNIQRELKQKDRQAKRVQRIDMPAKLVQARTPAKFGPLMGGPGSMAEKKRTDALATQTRKSNQKSDLQTKLFGVGSLRQGWKPPTGNLTGMQKSYLAKNQGNISSKLDAQGNFLRKKEAPAPATPKADPVKAVAAAQKKARSAAYGEKHLVAPQASAKKPAAVAAKETRPKTTPDGKPIRYIDIKEPMVITGKPPAKKYTPPTSLAGANYAARKKYIEHHGGNARDRSTWNKSVRSAMNNWWKGHVAAKQKAKSQMLAQN